MATYAQMLRNGTFGSVAMNYRRAFIERYGADWLGTDNKLASICDEVQGNDSSESDELRLDAMKQYEEDTFPPNHPVWQDCDDDLPDVLSDEYWQK